MIATCLNLISTPWFDCALTSTRCIWAHTTLHYTTLHYTTLHYTTLHYTTLHYTTLHYTTLHYTTLHYTTLHYTTLHYTTLHYTTLHYTTLHYTTLHYTTLHYMLVKHQVWLQVYSTSSTWCHCCSLQECGPLTFLEAWSGLLGWSLKPLLTSRNTISRWTPATRASLWTQVSSAQPCYFLDLSQSATCSWVKPFLKDGWHQESSPNMAWKAA